jgi:hypothetical protein
MRQETYTCDVCGGARGEGNRWLVGWVVDGGFALADWGFAPKGGERVYHFCSETHALVEQGKHLRQDRHAVTLVAAEEPARRPAMAEGRVIHFGDRSRVG